MSCFQLVSCALLEHNLLIVCVPLLLPADAAPTAAAVEAPARRGRRTSSAKAASPAEDTTTAAAASTPAEAPAGTPTVSRAKLLAQQLAKKEIATHGTGAAAAAAAAATAATAAAGDAATAEPAAAAPGSAWVGADELLYAGSQAQSDNLLIGGDNSMQVGCKQGLVLSQHPHVQCCAPAEVLTRGSWVVLLLRAQYCHGFVRLWSMGPSSIAGASWL